MIASHAERQRTVEKALQSVCEQRGIFGVVVVTLWDDGADLAVRSRGGNEAADNLEVQLMAYAALRVSIKKSGFKLPSE